MTRAGLVCVGYIHEAFAGPLPSEIQFVSVFSTALVAGSQQPEPAKKLIAFLTSEAARPAIRASGMEPLAAR